MLGRLVSSTRAPLPLQLRARDRIGRFTPKAQIPGVGTAFVRRTVNANFKTRAPGRVYSMSTNGNVYIAGRSSSTTSWEGGSLESLSAWMEQCGLNVQQYEVKNAKTVNSLREEVLKGETTLTLEGDVPVRSVSVVSVLLKNASGQTLMEERQVFPDGRERCRGLPLSEKMLGGEDWLAAAYRGIQEELGTILTSDSQIALNEQTHLVEYEQNYSMSYPGLLTKYTLHRIQGTVSDLPQSGSFSTTEATPQGTLTNFWTWTDKVGSKLGSTKTKLK